MTFFLWWILKLKNSKRLHKLKPETSIYPSTGCLPHLLWHTCRVGSLSFGEFLKWQICYTKSLPPGDSCLQAFGEFDYPLPVEPRDFYDVGFEFLQLLKNKKQFFEMVKEINVNFPLHDAMLHRNNTPSELDLWFESFGGFCWELDGYHPKEYISKIYVSKICENLWNKMVLYYIPYKLKRFKPLKTFSSGVIWSTVFSHDVFMILNSLLFQFTMTSRRIHYWFYQDPSNKWNMCSKMIPTHQ